MKRTKSNTLLRMPLRPLLTFGVIAVPILTSFLPAFLADPRDLVFGGFLAGCLMCAIIFGRR